jgi:imidazolonepropionase-like amidohydrolase
MWTDRYHAAGFQQMKIYSSIKLENLKAVAEEAHRLGMTVTGHVPEGLTGYQTIPAGQDQINHISYIAAMMQKPLAEDASRADRRNAAANLDLNSQQAQKALTFLKEHHTVVDPTIALFELFTGTTAKPPASFEPGIAKIPPELAQQLTDVAPPNENTEIGEKIFKKSVAIVGALHRTGVPIVAGTDQAVPGHSLHRELELYVEAGFTPMEAIQAATIVPARVMGLDKDTGTVEKGKRADLILIGGNPLEDIRNTRNVEYVFTNGTMYHAAELWQSVGFKP